MAETRNGFLIVLCAWLIGLSAMIQTCEGTTYPWPFKKRHVEILNAFPQGPLPHAKGLPSPMLHLHCKSKEDDLGVHVLVPGQTYEWGFSVNWSSTTLYFCNMWWDRGQKSFEVYYADQVLYDICGPGNVCRWMAHEFGVSLYNAKKNTWRFMYNWEPRAH